MLMSTWATWWYSVGIDGHTMDALRRQVTDRSLKPLAYVIDVIAERGSDIPLSVLQCFMYVAMRDGCHLQALEEDLNLGTASGSRNTDWLSIRKRDGKPGFGLIIKQRDPTNRRRVMLRLTVRGRKLVDLIKKELNHG